MNEQWHDCDFVGDIREYPIDDKFNSDLDDYDERRKGEKTHWTDLQ